MKKTPRNKPSSSANQPNEGVVAQKAAGEKVAAKLTVTSVLAFWTLVVTVATPLTYLSGRSYHDGWYHHFNLAPDMFPTDTAGTLTYAAYAWINGISGFLTPMLEGLIKHWLFVVGYVIFLVLLYRGVEWFIRMTSRRDELRRSNQPPQRNSKLKQGARWVGEPILGLGVSLSALAMFFFAITFLLFLILAPFQVIGENRAEAAIKNHFAGSPAVTVTSPSGEKIVYHIIGCGPQFCGLYGADHAITVPVSKIDWSESAPPKASEAK